MGPTVSKAALWSKRIKIAFSPLSEISQRCHFDTKMLKVGMKPRCLKLYLIKENIEIGLTLLKTEGSKFGLFKGGFTTAFKKIRNKPFSKELLIIIKIMGPTVSMTCCWIVWEWQQDYNKAMI